MKVERISNISKTSNTIEHQSNKYKNRLSPPKGPYITPNELDSATELEHKEELEKLVDELKTIREDIESKGRINPFTK